MAKQGTTVSVGTKERVFWEEWLRLNKQSGLFLQPSLAREEGGQPELFN